VRARALAAAVTGSAAVLGLAWGIGHGQEGMVTAPIPMPAPVASAGHPAARAVGEVRDGTEHRYTGATVQTKYGPMQVGIAVRAGRLVRVWALRLTDRYGRSVRASTSATPVLERRSIAAGSADIAGVTGATYTSDGYRRSLQSALDEAAR
jgi:uncharacterized protein with FMN-binding domain